MISSCIRLGPGKYSLGIASSTVPEALCKLSHALQESSEAYCIRHHPHDENVELVMDVSTLPMLQIAFEERLRTYTLTPGDNDDVCHVDCPTFWVANIIRRTLWTSVQVVACSSVLIHKNTSAFEDAMIAHRCGQIALRGNSHETRSTLKVESRDAFGKDIVFGSGGLSVAPSSMEAPIVKLRAGEEFQAELYFKLGRPLDHAKFHCVAAPSYYADITLERKPSAEEHQILSEHGYAVDASLRCSRLDLRPARADAIQEIARALPVRVGPGVRMEVESLGQMSALECVKAAIFAVLKETSELASTLTECERSVVCGDEFCALR